MKQTSRVSDKELKAATKFTPSNVRAKANVRNSLKTSVVSYDKAGKVTEVHKDVAARLVTNKTGKVYSVLVNRFRQLYRPNDQMYLRESENRARQESLPPFSLIVSNDKAFGFFLKYLETKNIRHYKEAQRNL